MAYIVSILYTVLISFDLHYSHPWRSPPSSPPTPHVSNPTRSPHFPQAHVALAQSGAIAAVHLRSDARGRTRVSTCGGAWSWRGRRSGARARTRWSGASSCETARSSGRGSIPKQGNLTLRLLTQILFFPFFFGKCIYVDAKFVIFFKKICFLTYILCNGVCGWIHKS